jgi:biopolymer transport protein ExbB
MVDLFIKGGILMYPLLIASIIALAVIIERSFQFTGTRLHRKIVDNIVRRSRSGKLKTTDLPPVQTKDPVAVLAAVVIESSKLKREEIERKVSIQGSKEIKRLSKNLHLLELIGKISPMIGLAGTVLGLSRTFQTVAALRGTAEASLLAGGIWEAMITTVAGLFVGIPSIIFHHLFQNRLRSIINDMKTTSEELIDSVKRQKQEKPSKSRKNPKGSSPA